MLRGGNYSAIAEVALPASKFFKDPTASGQHHATSFGMYQENFSILAMLAHCVPWTTHQMPENLSVFPIGRQYVDFSR